MIIPIFEIWLYQYPQFLWARRDIHRISFTHWVTHWYTTHDSLSYSLIHDTWLTNEILWMSQWVNVNEIYSFIYSLIHDTWLIYSSIRMTCPIPSDRNLSISQSKMNVPFQEDDQRTGSTPSIWNQSPFGINQTEITIKIWEYTHTEFCERRGAFAESRFGHMGWLRTVGSIKL